MTRVNVGCIAIPDGVENGRCRVSVMLTPDPKLADTSVLIDLDNWPSQIATGSAETKLWIEVSRDGAPSKVHHFERDSFNNWPMAPKRNAVVESSNKLWRQIFRDYPASVERYRFEELKKIFEKPVQPGPGLLSFGAKTIDPASFRFVGTYALTKTMMQYKESMIAARLLYAVAVARIRDARRQKTNLSRELDDLAANGPVASLLARPFADPLLDYRLRAAMAFGFPDLRPDAIGRLDGLRSNRGGALDDNSTFREYVEKAKANFSSFFDRRGAFPRGRNGEPVPDTVGTLVNPSSYLKTLDDIPAWLEVELGLVEPSGDLKLRDPENFSKLVRSQLVAQELSNPIEPRPSARRKPTDSKEKAAQDDEDLRRKFTGIRSFPMLAKFLGFIVDIKVPIGDGTVYIAAGFGTKENFKSYLESSSVVRTACVVAGDTFVAAHNPDIKRDGNDYVVDNGVLNFGSKSDSYSIQTVDGTLLLQSFAHESANLIDGFNNGAMADTLGSKLPETQTRGLQIIHKDAPRQAVASLNRAVDRTRALAAASAGQILYAENLLIGFRLDVRRTKVTKASPKKLDWASLTARNLTIHEIRDAFPDKPRHPYKDCRERDFGVLRRVQKQIPDGKDKLGPAPSQVLATWMGDHLGVPTPQFSPSDGEAKATPREVHVHTDLGVTVDYDFSDLKEDVAPVLRMGDGYEFGLRAVMPNGASISLAEAKNLYKKKAFVLGNGDDAYIYRHFNDIRPPQVLLPQDDPLARPASAADTPNERDDRIVLRLGSGNSRRKVRRFLVPGRVSFEQAEQFGLLDDQMERKVPFGAFRQFRRDPATGAFPSVKSGKIEQHERGDHPVTGAVLVQRPGPIANESAPYFPDPLGRNLKVMFERSRSVPDGFEEESPLRSFWDRGASPRSALPILLEIRPNDALGSGGRFLPSDLTETIGGVKFPKLTVEISPAETVTLWYWALPDHEDEEIFCGHTLAALSAFNNWQLTNNHVRGALGAGPSDKIAEYLEEIRTKPESPAIRRSRSGRDPGPSVAERAVRSWMEDLAKLPSFDTKGWGKIDVVYAVEKPLRVPVFRMKGGKPEFNPVRIAPENIWNEDLIKRIEKDPTFKGDRGGTTLFLTGAVEFDRRSTVELTGDFSAEDFSDSRSVRKVDKKWQFKPAARLDHLFRVKMIPVDHGANEPGIFNLARDEAGMLRSLSYDFGQITSQNATAAHEISVRLVAKSRFEREFDHQAKDDPARFEHESRNPFRGSPPSGKRGPAEKSVQHEFKFWVPSTERPPKPVVDRVTWTSPTRTFRTDNKIVVERWCCPRIYLSRPWFISGADELLAVVCAPATLVDDRPFHRDSKPSSLIEPWNLLPREKSRADEVRRLTMKEYQTGSLASVAEYVTRWGADATTESGKLDPVIAPERFRGFVATVQNMKLPLPKAERPALRAQNRRLGVVDDPDLPQVSAFLYKPQLDEDTGLWYVDIGIDPGAAHKPFVQLSIARYQPHSLDGLALSEPFVMDAIQIPAKRTVEIDLVDGRRVIAKVQGAGYVRRSPFNVDNPAVPWRELTDVPLQNVQLLRQDGRAVGAVAAFDIYGRRIEGLRIQPIADGADLIWICPFELPTPLNSGGKYYIQFDEIELHIPDEDLRVTSLPDNAEFFVEKPEMFSCRVAL